VGRLADLASAPGALPVTWMLDPEVLEAAAALAAAHERRNGTAVSDAAADPNAAAWLATLRAQLTTGGRWPPCPTRIRTRRRWAAARTATRSPGALLPLPGPVTARLLGPGVGHPGWPGRRQATSDATTLATLRRTGARTVVLAGGQIPTLATLTYTPTGRARVQNLGGPVGGVARRHRPRHHLRG